MKRSYTVLLLYPNTNGVETYQAHVMAVSPKQALFFARYEVAKRNDNIHDKDEYMPIAVYLGHLEDLNVEGNLNHADV